jgi:hypothetical protein
MMPYGRHCSVKGSLSRIGVDMNGSIRNGLEPVSVAICSRKTAEVSSGIGVELLIVLMVSKSAPHSRCERSVDVHIC